MMTIEEVSDDPIQRTSHDLTQPASLTPLTFYRHVTDLAMGGEVMLHRLERLADPLLIWCDPKSSHHYDAENINLYRLWSEAHSVIDHSNLETHTVVGITLHSKKKSTSPKEHHLLRTQIAVLSSASAYISSLLHFTNSWRKRRPQHRSAIRGIWLTAKSVFVLFEDEQATTLNEMILTSNKQFPNSKLRERWALRWTRQLMEALTPIRPYWCKTQQRIYSSKNNLAECCWCTYSDWFCGVSTTSLTQQAVQSPFAPLTRTNIILTKQGDLKLGLPPFQRWMTYSQTSLNPSSGWRDDDVVAPEIHHQRGSRQDRNDRASTLMSPALDVWQIGVFVVELLAGQRVFRRQENQHLHIAKDVETMLLRMQGHEPAIRCSKKCLSFVKCCLKMDPQERSTFRELSHHPWVNY
eukprot:GHVN01066025.1.p2 GENE.GHVN01066025.1~~GHVN01066025.1.p2  ORF type:complete len:409 (+),score=69.03 GHVN01066025.1:725-1951(+)